MQRKKRPFYIIGHNPNTIAEAEEFLKLGANALEPDIIHINNGFYISHTHEEPDADTPTLESYLTDLKGLLTGGSYDLALIIFDIKDNDFDINSLVSVIRQNFSGPPCDGVALLLTHADDHQFVGRYDRRYDNVGIGVDESNMPPAELERFFREGGHNNFSYADGITTALTKPGVYTNVRAAQRCCHLNAPRSFRLVYTWVLTLEGSMRRYLDTHIDGIFVDPGSVNELKKLLASEPYSEVYEPARFGYNPYTADCPPQYVLAVRTADKAFAGTDARLVFTLKGRSGLELKSLPFNADQEDALERDTTTYITLEGLDLGEIESLTIEALTDGLGSGWLPAEISVESRLLAAPVRFHFDTKTDWLTLKGGPITRMAAQLQD